MTPEQAQLVDNIRGSDSAGVLLIIAELLAQARAEERERCLNVCVQIALSLPPVRASMLWEAAENIDYDAARTAQGFPAAIRARKDGQ